MAEQAIEVLTPGGRLIDRVPAIRPLLMLVGVAASIAVGVGVVLWSQSPEYGVLFSDTAEGDVRQIVETLQNAGVPYEVDPYTGAVKVPTSRIPELQMLLNAQGIPYSGNKKGMELWLDDQGFGISRTAEEARLQITMQTEFERSIARLQSVQSARVQLALPRQSAFIRNKKNASASVSVILVPGRQLNKNLAAAIGNIVASGVVDIEPSQVTIIDQYNRFMNGASDAEDLNSPNSQFEYKKLLEDNYSRSIEELLSPILGPGSVRAKVTADLDFTLTEETRENYEPNPEAIRSERVASEERVGSEIPSGIPGAISNQPPVEVPQLPQAAGTAVAADGSTVPAGQLDAVTPEPPRTSSQQQQTNYELPKTITHTKMPMGRIIRMSVAVVVDNLRGDTGAGADGSQPLTEDELATITSIVREAIGYSEARGDTISVINKPFVQPEAIAPPEEIPIWKTPAFMSIGKQVLGVLLVLVIVFTVLRPAIKGLAEAPRSPVALSSPGAVADPGVVIPGGQPQVAPMNYEQQLAAAQSMVSQDPQKVAQVVRNWVGSDG